MIGEAWAHEYVSELQAQARPPAGGWPGTMGEARHRILTHIATSLDRERLNELARVANLAAKRGWRAACQADLES